MSVPVLPSAFTFQIEAPNYRFYHLWLEHMLEHLTNAAVSIYNVGLFLNDSTAVVITFGAPYLHYKLYRHDGINETDSREEYSEMIKGLDMLWDQYSNFLLPILPVLFPMVTSSGASSCSIGSIAATMTFTAGAASIGTKIIFKLKAKALHNEHAINEWRRASAKSWRKIPNKSFWILFSLPTVFFFLSICLLILTVMLTFWERPVADVTPKPGMQACTMIRLEAFKYTLLTTLIATVTHFAFVIIKLHFLTAFKTVEPTSAA